MTDGVTPETARTLMIDRLKQARLDVLNLEHFLGDEDPAVRAAPLLHDGDLGDLDGASVEDLRAAAQTLRSWNESRALEAERLDRVAQRREERDAITKDEIEALQGLMRAPSALAQSAYLTYASPIELIKMHMHDELASFVDLLVHRPGITLDAIESALTNWIDGEWKAFFANPGPETYGRAWAAEGHRVTVTTVRRGGTL